MAWFNRLGKTIFQATARQIPLSFFIKISGQQLFCPFYHLINERAAPHVKHLYPVRSISEFEADLDFLLTHFQPIELNDLLGNKPLKKPSFWLSFDDGLRQCFDYIRPILLRKGIPATFFINPAFIDNRALMFRYKTSLLINVWETQPDKHKVFQSFFSLSANESPKDALQQIKHTQQAKLDALAQLVGLDFQAFLKSYQPYMRLSQIQTLLDDGFSVGSHSWDHPNYANCSIEQQIEQTIQAQDWLNEQLSLKQEVFAFPFSDWGVSDAFFEQILADGKFEATFGTAGLKKERVDRHFPRFPMEKNPSQDARTLIHTEYFAYLFKRILGRHWVRRS